MPDVLRWWEHTFDHGGEVPALKVRLWRGLKWRVLFPLASFILDFLNWILDLIFWFIQPPDDKFWH